MSFLFNFFLIHQKKLNNPSPPPTFACNINKSIGKLNKTPLLAIHNIHLISQIMKICK